MRQCRLLLSVRELCFNIIHYELSLPDLPLISDDLLLRLDFRDPTPEVIDLSPVGGVVSTLQEGKIECLSGDKVRPINF